MKRVLEINRPSSPAKPASRIKPFVWTVFSMFGIFGGISSLFVGIVSVILHGILAGDKIFDRVGTILLIVAIPLILVGSIFLDGINTKNN